MIELARSNSWQTSDNFPDRSARKCDFLVFSLIMIPGHIPFERRLVFLLSHSVRPRPSDSFPFPFISYSALFIATMVNL